MKYASLKRQRGLETLDKLRSKVKEHNETVEQNTNTKITEEQQMEQKQEPVKEEVEINSSHY